MINQRFSDNIGESFPIAARSMAEALGIYRQMEDEEPDSIAWMCEDAVILTQSMVSEEEPDT